MEGETLVHLSPEKILADDNSRFGLKRTRIDELKENIMEVGGVLVSLEVEPLDTPANGHTHRLTAGFYRHAAALELNKEQQAGITLPCVVRTTGDTLMRLKHQVYENHERENMSPMDEATAIKRLMDAGVARMEVRNIFRRPGGKKGTTTAPMSNAMLNIFLRFLDLPKAVQEKIHDGRVGVEAAYELGKVSPEKRQAVLDRAEAERLKLVEAQEKDEEKYLTQQKKLTEAESKQAEAVKEAESLKAAVVVAKEALKEKETALKEVQKTPFLDLAEDEKKAVMRKLTDVKGEVTAAKKAVKDRENEVAKALSAATKAADVIESAKAKLEAARKAGTKKTKKSVGAADVKKAAQAEGASKGFVALNLSEIRIAVKDVAGQTDYPKAALIGKLFQKCFEGETTPKQLCYDIARLTGEAKAPQGVKTPKE